MRYPDKSDMTHGAGSGGIGDGGSGLIGGAGSAG